MIRRFGCYGWRLPLPGRWQLELWFCPRDSAIPAHVHPNIDSWLVFLAGRMIWQRKQKQREFTWRDIGKMFEVPLNCPHGATVTGLFGLFMNVERWVPMCEKTSAATDLKLTWE